MSWGDPTPAIPILRPPSASLPDYVDVTSTSTVEWTDGRHARLRMFCKDPGSLSKDYQSIVLSSDIPPSRSPADLEYHYIAILDSDTRGAFSIDLSASPAFGTTWIATRRRLDGERLDVIQRWTDPLSTRPTTSTEGDVSYADPSVVAVPDALGGGYLMLLSRHRAFTAPTASASTTGSEKDISDIIAYWSETLDFRDDSGAVQGPLLLVDSLDGLLDGPFRAWLSVPSAAFVLDPATQPLRLHVYDGVEIPSTPHHEDEASGHEAAVTASPYAAHSTVSSSLRGS